MKHPISLVLLICIVGICNLLFILPASASDKKALLICVERFQNKALNDSKAIPALKNDVIQLKSVLAANGFDVTVLDTTSKKKYRSTQRNILRMLSKFKKNTLSRQTLLVFFTGHGKGKYLLPYDFEPGFEDSGLELSKVVHRIKNAGAGKKFFFIDACHSGRAIDGGFVKDAKDYTIDQTIFGERENQEEGFFTITSSRAEENSYVDETADISYFTKYLVKGLKGEADGFGRNNRANCVVELPELHEYLEQSVSDAVIKDIRPKVNEDVTQRPNILATGNLNTALIRLKKDVCRGKAKSNDSGQTFDIVEYPAVKPDLVEPVARRQENTHTIITGKGKLYISMARGFEGATAYIRQPGGPIIKASTPAQLIDLALGSYEITLKKYRFHDRVLSLDIGTGWNKVETIKLAPCYGWLTLDSEPEGASVYLDNQHVGTTPLKKQEVISRSYALRVEKDAWYEDHTGTVRIQDLKETTQKIHLSPRFGTLEIHTRPFDADVIITGAATIRGSVTDKGFSTRLYPGTYYLTIKKELYQPVSDRKIIISRGSTLKNNFNLSASFGTLSVTSKPSSAKVKISNGITEISPVKNLKLAPGTYQVALEKQAFVPVTFNVTIVRNTNVPINETLEPKTGLLSISADPLPSDLKLYVNDQLIKDAALPDTLKNIPEGRSTILCKGTIQGKPYEGRQTVSVAWNRETSVHIQLKPSGPRKGDTWKDPVTGMAFVWVPEGCYKMGSNSGGSDEKPVHEVCVDGFWMGKYEVTQGQWKKIMGNNPSRFKSGDDYPVERVSWNDAQNYISRLSQPSGNDFSLPTEAQWEYAARSGGRDEEYADGNDINSVAWYRSNSGKKTQRVGTKAPNGLGIYDMSGNVWEWCKDVYDKNAYSKHDRNNPLVTSGGNSRVHRGGSWLDTPGPVRAALRGRRPADFRNSHVGFRLCLSRVRQ